MPVRDRFNVLLRAELYNYIMQHGQIMDVLGAATIGDIAIEAWYYDANSMLTDNGLTVIKPTVIDPSAPGRYLKGIQQADYNQNLNNPNLSIYYLNSNPNGYLSVVPSQSWSSIIGKPTTLAGYGITDPIVLTSGSYTDPSWIASLGWSKISGTPTTVVGYGITDAVTNSSLTTTLSSYATTSVLTSGLAGKENSITAGTTSQYWRGDKSFQVLNTSVVPESSNLYYTDTRARNAITLTVTGTTGTAASYTPSTGVLNIPTPKRIETYLGTTDSSGNYTVTYGTAYSVIPDVQPQLQAGTVTQTARITASSTTGFTINVQNRTDALGLLPSYSPVNGASVGVLVTSR